MSFRPFLTLLRRPGVASLMAVAIFARIPHAATGLALSLHVINTMNLSFLRAGIVTTVFTVGVALGAPWRGRMIDRRGLRRAMAPSIVVESAAWIAAPFLGFQALLVAVFAAGLFMVPVFSVVRQALAVLARPEEQATAFALDSVCTEMTFILAPVLVTILATEVSTGLALVVVGIATVVAGVVIMLLNPPTRSAATEDGDNPGARIKKRGEEGKTPKPSIFSWSLAAVLGATFALSVTFSGQDLGIVGLLREWGRTELTGVSFALLCLGSVTGGLIYGAMGKSFHPLWLVFGVAAVTAPLALASTVPVLFVLLFAAGVMTAPSLSAINATVVRLVPENRRGEALGWNGTTMTVGSSLAAPMCGVFIDAYGAQAAFVVAAVISVIFAALGLVLYRGSAIKHRKLE